MSLNGKTLFITGASRGIGLAIALRAARDGANIAIAAKTDTPHPKLPGTIHTAAAEIEQAGGKALPLVVDVRDEASVKAGIARTAETFGGIDIVVNNASAVQITPVEHTKRMEAALKRAGVPVEALYYPKEGHGFYEPAHRREFYTRMLRFLDRHIGAGRG